MSNVRLSLVALGLMVLGVDAKHSNPPHTDGIEPYYNPPACQEYLDTLSPEMQQIMFASKADMEWWEVARFGFFVHWGPSSMLPCSMSWGRKGPRPQHSSDGHVTKGVPQEIYDNQYKKFKAEKFDANEWIRLVKASGAKYFIFTAKHHDGFCMFDTQLTDYNIMHTPYGRDVVKELTDACHKQGIKVALYYSQPDWNNEIYASGDMKRYCDEYLFPQIRELLTNYGRIDVMWFDGLGRSPETWDAPKLIKMVRELQPGILVNHRFSRPPWHMGDFDGPERSIGRFQTNRPWETCTVIGGGWAWMGDAPAMPLKQAMSLLVRCAGGDGNLALGVGPRGDGSFVEDHEKRLHEMGGWLKQYGESIYGTHGGPYIPGIWGASTYKGNTVYLHLLASWNGTLELPPLPAKIRSLDVLSGGEAQFVQSSEKVVVQMDSAHIDPIDTLIKLTLDRTASEIAPIKTLGVPVSIGAMATASSERAPDKSAKNVVASDAKEFSEGIFVKSAWESDPKDRQPWLALKLSKPESVSQIKLMEGRFGSGGHVQEYVLEVKVSKDWKTIHSGKSIGGDCNILLKEPVVSDTFRLRILERNGHVTLNSFELYE